jgi:site-specific DNA-methyltransferase (adenine-specific)
LQGLDFDLELTGFDADEIASEPIDGLTDEDEVPEAPEEPKTKLGDIWLLGNHRVMCGDSTDSEQVAKLMDSKKADMVFTDPPYGLGIDGQKKSISKNPKHNRKQHVFKGWDSNRPPDSYFESILSMGIPAIIFGGNYFADLLPATRGWIYWDKGQNGLTMSDGELAWTSSNKPLRAVVCNRANIGNSVHPTQKPLKVVEFCLNQIEADLVYDSFLGSGSTLIACEKTGRTCYGMELDPKYVDVIVKRWEDFTGKKAVLDEA